MSVAKYMAAGLLGETGGALAKIGTREAVNEIEEARELRREAFEEKMYGRRRADALADIEDSRANDAAVLAEERAFKKTLTEDERRHQADLLKAENDYNEPERTLRARLLETQIENAEGISEVVADAKVNEDGTWNLYNAQGKLIREGVEEKDLTLKQTTLVTAKELEADTKRQTLYDAAVKQLDNLRVKYAEAQRKMTADGMGEIPASSTEALTELKKSIEAAEADVKRYESQSHKDDRMMESVGFAMPLAKASGLSLQQTYELHRIKPDDPRIPRWINSLTSTNEEEKSRAQSEFAVLKAVNTAVYEHINKILPQPVPENSKEGLLGPTTSMEDAASLPRAEGMQRSAPSTYTGRGTGEATNPQAAKIGDALTRLVSGTKNSEQDYMNMIERYQGELDQTPAGDTAHRRVLMGRIRDAKRNLEQLQSRK